MAKDKTVYICNECGGTSPKWLGKCPACQAWNTLIESVASSEAPTKNRFAALAKTAEVAVLCDIEASDVERTPTGHEELDRVLGGGMVEGGVVLIGGDPGIGKSTLLLQALDSLQRHFDARRRASGGSDPDAAGPRGGCLYVTGEESGAQVALRSRRLGLDRSQVKVLAEIQLEKILATLATHSPDVAVIDSIQTVYSEQLTSAPGSVAQVRGQGQWHRHCAGRPRYQGRRLGRAACAGAHGGHGALLRGRHPQPVPPGARHQEPFWRGQ
jgi:DNA repair protein RadA/Sms